MSRFAPHLRWIDDQHERMVRLVTNWANINSGSRNIIGLSQLSVELSREFEVLGGQQARISLPSECIIDPAGRRVDVSIAQAISIRKRPQASMKVFLCIHMDTVYGPDNPFQTVRQIDAQTIAGPGVADAKGGLCVMLIALEALERSPFAGQIGWEVLINPDEEIGSPGSGSFMKEAAQRNQIGMVFEPALPDGALVGERKGSGNFDAIIHGRSAHAGRDFQHGRNAMHAAAAMVIELDELNRMLPGVTVNVGRIDGGGPSNVVPDLAVVRFNCRVPTPQLLARVDVELNRIAKEIDQRDGISVELYGGFRSPPKMMDATTLRLYEQVADCGRDLGLSLTWRPSGGASDGNKLAAAGLPVIDTLGPRGGSIHSSEEYLLLDSLTERAKLSALLLMKLASGEIQPMQPKEEK
jgi:glutamate carboxypeptidase